MYIICTYSYIYIYIYIYRVYTIILIQKLSNQIGFDTRCDLAKLDLEIVSSDHRWWIVSGHMFQLCEHFIDDTTSGQFNYTRALSENNLIFATGGVTRLEHNYYYYCLGVARKLFRNNPRSARSAGPVGRCIVSSLDKFEHALKEPASGRDLHNSIYQ